LEEYGMKSRTDLLKEVLGLIPILITLILILVYLCRNLSEQTLLS